MPQSAYLTIGIIAAYLLGSIPSGYLAARWTTGIDLRKHGTGGIGLSNVWHSVPARWVIVPVVLWDICKVMPAVWWAAAVGLDLSCQVIIGMTALIGHNWPVYLRFHGGRGMLCTVGFAFILPVANGMAPWPLIAGLVVLFSALAIIRSSAISVGLAILTPVVTSLIMGDPLPLSLGYLAAFLLMIFRRLVQPRSPLSAGMPWRQVLFYRFFLDRDIKDRKKWVKR